MRSFGRGKDQLEGFYIENRMLGVEGSELDMDDSELICRLLYDIENEGVFSREEQRKRGEVDGFLLSDEDGVVLGCKVKDGFKIKGLVGECGMSYGGLGKNGISAV